MALQIMIIGKPDPDILMIRDVLIDHKIIEVINTEKALSCLKSYNISLIIIDFRIYDEEKIELIKLIKKCSDTENFSLIIVTDKDKPEIEIEGLLAGADDYIRRPLYHESLKARLKLHLDIINHRELKQMFAQYSYIYNSVFQQAPIGITVSIDNKLVRVNPMIEKITGRSKKELLEISWEKLTHPQDLEKDLTVFKKLMSGEITSYSMEKRYIRPDGSIVWVDMAVAAITLPDQKEMSHLCLVQDITKRKKAEKDLIESERSKSVLLSNLPGMAYRCLNDTNWTMLFVSNRCYDLTGYSPESLINNRDISFNEIISPEYREILSKEWQDRLYNKEPFKFEYEIITSSGERKWVLEMGEGVFDETGGIEALEGIILDISDRKVVEDSLRYNNEHDTWTGLYNRRYLEALLESDDTNTKRALISINLSSIQLLSMTTGFNYTRDLIKKIAGVLSVFCNDDIMLFNTYENRFVFYLKSYKSKEHLGEFCEDIVNVLDSILATDKVSGGIGVIQIDEHSSNSVELILKNLLITSEKAANMEHKDFDVVFFNEKLQEDILREEDIKRELIDIAYGEKEDNLFLHFQPILSLKTNSICGFEALARLKHEKLGQISPVEFIPIAEKTKIIVPLGDLIMKKAFSFRKELMNRGYNDINVSINVSAIQLLREDFKDKLLYYVKDAKVNPENISIEITESVFSSDYHGINNLLGELKKFGFKIAIDDFGTGYSSLARERELNVNAIKIDRYFIDKLMTLKEEEAITGDIISMAHKLGHNVVAEGIEHEEQRRYLEKHGCDKIQGFLISRPVEASEALRMLSKG